MKLVFASDYMTNKDMTSSCVQNEERNDTDWYVYLEAFSEIMVCYPSCSYVPHDSSPVLHHDSRVSFYHLPPLNGPLSMLNYRFETMKIVQKALQKADVLIARLPSEVGFIAIQAAKLLNKPWAVEVVSSAEEYYDTSLGKLLSPIMNLRLQKMIGQAPAALYATNHFLQRRYPCNGRMISRSSSQFQAHLPHISTDRLQRIATCYEREVYHIGLGGTLSGQSKGIDIALKALKKVQQLTVKTVKLDIVGEGDPARWKRLAEELYIEDVVNFKGIMNQRTMRQDWLDSLDLYIQPSRQDSQPKVMLEAMGRGVPVFGSRVGGISELLSPEQLMKPEDDNRLAMLICDLINDTTKQRRLAGRSLEAASAHNEDALRMQRLEFFSYVINHVAQRQDKKELVESNPFR
ncbi:glycosyltransferase [Paenibacillus rigui]|uniref:Uncharacterized protein n=1 Tax=Paenibacillus rigui TaxID=554312 RepID=A0A229UNN8_9BACL|nr:glycosyltransferase [Paenibacillus rigui]OXM84964.1 hypothetical protein CF651_18865 [Paenibacillus rigui]